jgi:O-antigen ligase
MMLTIVGYVVVFLLIRELSWRFGLRPWQTLLPIICLGGLEAAYGMSQVWQATESPRASGSFSNWDHFSGFLEITLPISVVYGVALMRRSHDRRSDSSARAAAACAVWAISALILIAIVYSLCRTGFLAALASLFVVAALCLQAVRLSRFRRWLAIVSLGLITAVLFIVLQPSQLIERFAGLSSGDTFISDARPILWKETCSLISEYPWFGVGSGGFESAFLKHQAVAVTTIVQFAHNDYLQYLADFGFVGLPIIVTALVGILIPLLKPLKNSESQERRLVAIACAGSIVALALHSIADFNSFVPATSITMAWILGAGSANGIAGKRISFR